MDCLQFVASIFESFTSNLAWPIALALIVYWLRHEIIILSKKLQSFSVAGLSANFGIDERLDQAEKEQEKISFHLGAADPIKKSDPNFGDRLQDAWDEVEVALRSFGAAIDGPEFLKTPSKWRLDGYYFKKRIGPKTYALIKYLIEIKDLADDNVTPQQVIRYERLADQAIKALAAEEARLKEQEEKPDS